MKNIRVYLVILILGILAGLGNIYMDSRQQADPAYMIATKALESTGTLTQWDKASVRQLLIESGAKDFTCGEWESTLTLSTGEVRKFAFSCPVDGDVLQWGFYLQSLRGGNKAAIRELQFALENYASLFEQILNSILQH